VRERDEDETEGVEGSDGVDGGMMVRSRDGRLGTEERRGWRRDMMG
jgi:hypothetical protein